MFGAGGGTSSYREVEQTEFVISRILAHREEGIELRRQAARQLYDALLTQEDRRKLGA